jgi:hypothetical protein
MDAAEAVTATSNTATCTSRNPRAQHQQAGHEGVRRLEDHADRSLVGRVLFVDAGQQRMCDLEPLAVAEHR